jgi:cobalamin biosynthesis Mg chelatase CobN
MKVVGYSSWAPDERANAMRRAFRTLREKTGQPWGDRMMKHGYSGVMEFGDIFKAMRSTEAALGNTIAPELWKRTVEVTLTEWDRISDANPHKTRDLAEILLDTQRRGMWEDRDLEQQLKDKLNELDADVELATYLTSACRRNRAAHKGSRRFDEYATSIAMRRGGPT